MPGSSAAGHATTLPPAQPVRRPPFAAETSESVCFCCRGASRAVDTEISTRPRLRAATDGVRQAGSGCPFGGRRRKRDVVHNKRCQGRHRGVTPVRRLGSFWTRHVGRAASHGVQGRTSAKRRVRQAAGKPTGLSFRGPSVLGKPRRHCHFPSHPLFRGQPVIQHEFLSHVAEKPPRG